MDATMVEATECHDGGVRIVFLGNSITLHGASPEIGWNNTEYGMAASAAKKSPSPMFA